MIKIRYLAVSFLLGSTKISFGMEQMKPTIQSSRDSWSSFVISPKTDSRAITSKQPMSLGLEDWELEIFEFQNIEEKQDSNGNTPLLLATRDGDLKMVKQLSENGANIFHKNHANLTAKDIAFLMNYKALFIFLLTQYKECVVLDCVEINK